MKILKDKEVIRIENGMDEIGQNIMRLQADQQFAKFRTGSYEKDPVREPLESMRTGFCRKMRDGWFYPSADMTLKFADYCLKQMREKKFSGIRKTLETGMLQTVMAEIRTDKDTYCFQRPETPYPEEPAFPGTNVLHVSHVQDASTAFAEDGETPPFQEVWKEALQLWNKKLEDEKAAGGKAEVTKECRLRNTLNKYRLYNLEMDRGSIRRVGERYLEREDRENE